MGAPTCQPISQNNLFSKQTRTKHQSDNNKAGKHLDGFQDSHSKLFKTICTAHEMSVLFPPFLPLSAFFPWDTERQLGSTHQFDKCPYSAWGKKCFQLQFSATESSVKALTRLWCLPLCKNTYVGFTSALITFPSTFSPCSSFQQQPNKRGLVKLGHFHYACPVYT